jgi:Aminoglycoside-2''-adenylyltransferase
MPAERAALPEPPPEPQPELDSEEFQRIYGPIRSLSPAQAATLFDGAPFLWWVAGGWSTELGPRPRREHEDLEVAVPRRDLGALREWLRDYHLWDTHLGALRFLGPDATVPRSHEQLWLRRDGYSPWLMDLMLTPVRGSTWLYKRDRRIVRQMADVVRRGPDGVPYQRPEISLLYKARRRAARDEQDFEAVLPALAADDRRWLVDAIDLSESADHPWLARLRAQPGNT